MNKCQSIRSRLLLWIGLPFTALAILALISSHLLLSRQINATFDDLLLNAAQRLERRIYTADGELRINMHYFSVSTLGSRGEGKIFYRIKESGGDMIAGFSGLTDPPTASQDPIFYDVDYAGNALRAVALTLPFRRGGEPVAICKRPDDRLSHRSYPLLAARDLIAYFIQEQRDGYQTA